jgi:WD40 repeat protein
MVVLVVALGVAGCSAESSSLRPTPPVNAPALHGPTAILTNPDGSNGGVVADYFSRDGRTLAAVDFDGGLYLWSMATRRLTASMPLIPAQVNSVAETPVFGLGPDDKTLAVGEKGTLGDQSGRVYLQDTATRALIATLTDPAGPFHPRPAVPIPNVPGPAPSGPPQGVLSIAFSPDGRTLAVADSGGFVDVYDTAGAVTPARPSEVAPLQGEVTSMAFSPDGRTLAVGDGSGDTYLWDTITRRVTATLADDRFTGFHEGPGVSSAEFSPDGRTLAVGDSAGQTYVWDIATRAVAARLTDPAPGGDPGQLYTSAAFSPDGRALATCDGYGTAYLWDIATHRIVATATDPRAQGMDSVAFSPDGRTLATGDVNGSTYLWAVPKGE